jgi:tungstate transport system ATP-binding protein
MKAIPQYFPLQWKNIGLQFENIVCLSDINFTLNASGITCIMGINGSGKTLLLKLCADLIQSNSGEIIWNQQPIPPQITWVPQRASVLDVSVKKNILKPLQHNLIADASERCQLAMEWAGITALKDKSALQLSTGEKQLLSLARAWALQPHILLLDEPTANLDPAKRQHIDKLIQALAKECKIIMSTHSIQQAKNLADDILLLEQGKLTFHGASQAFFQSDDFQRYLGNV